MFDFLVLLNDVFNLADNALKCPLCQVCRHHHVLLLNFQLNLLDLLHEVSHLKHLHIAVLEVIEHFLRKVAVNSVFLENSDFLNCLWDLGHDTRDKDRNFLLLEIAAQNLKLRTSVPFRHLHRSKQAC